MPVNTPCNHYKKNKDKWFKCRTAAAGEDAVKEAGVSILPALTEQNGVEYNAYKGRALFYGATGRTVDGLLGAIFRKSPQIEQKQGRIKEELKSVTPDYQDCDNFASQMVYEILICGRVGVLVDAPANDAGKAYLATYQTESIINWRLQDTGRGLALSLVVLEEEYDEAGDDQFVTETKQQYRVLELTEDGVYQQRVFRAHVAGERKEDENTEYAEVEDATVIPQVGGRALDYIPFMFVNAVDTTTRIYDAPILALANVNFSHYRSSADLEHGRHFTGLPTAWVAGFDKKDVLRIGSQIAWISEDSDAHAGYLEFTGQGLGSLENALKEKQEMMAVLGARMLEDTKKVVESDKTLSTRYRGENNVLSSIAKTASGALSTLFTWLMEWRGISTKITVQLNTDFINDRLSAKEVKELMESWQGGSFSWEVLFYNYKRGEVYPEDIDMEEEKNRMANEVDMDVRSRTDEKVDATDRVDGELSVDVV